MSGDKSKLMESCVFLALMAVLFIVFMIVEVLVVRWALGLFGWHFGFWTTFGIMCAVNMLFGGLRVTVRK